MFLHIKNEMMNPGVRTVPCRIQAEKTSTLPDVLDIGKPILFEKELSLCHILIPLFLQLNTVDLRYFKL